MPRPPWFDPVGIGRRLQQARGSLSQRELGRALGYRQPHVSRYERGEIPGSFRYLAGLAALRGVDLNWVLTGRRSASGSPAVPGDEEGESGETPLENIVRRAVRDAIEELASTRAPGDPLEGRAGTSSGAGAGATLSLPVRDRLGLELPMILRPLLEPSSGPAGQEPGAGPGVSLRFPGEGDRAAGSLDALLEALAALAKAGSAAAAAERLRHAAEEAEGSGAGPTDHEVSRLLRLWAWLVLERGAPEAARRRGPALLFEIARSTRLAGRAREAAAFYEAALERAEHADDRGTAARVHAGLGHVSFEIGDFARARRHYVAALEKALEAGDSTLLMFAHLDLAACHHEAARDYTAALEHARAGLDLARRTGDAEHEGRFLNEIGLNEMESGDLEAAEKRFVNVIAMGERLGSSLLRVIGTNNLADARIRRGALVEAKRLLGTSRALAREAGWTWAEAQAEILRARLDHRAGRSAAALERLEAVRERAAAEGLAHEDRRARELERAIRRSVIGRLEAAGA